MVTAYAQLLEVKAQHDTDLRTAALIIAIDKIAVSYGEMGIFP
jgi:glutamate dehydrogenase (NAD(P)+)